MKSTTEKSKEIQAVLFDVDDTLYDQAQPFAKACEALFGRVYSFSIDALFASSRRHSDEVFELSRSGAISMEEMYIYRIQRAFADFQIPFLMHRLWSFKDSMHKTKTTFRCQIKSGKFWGCAGKGE